ncbi:ribonuclease H-like domain-containing protein [Tanacetum coccineum]
MGDENPIRTLGDYSRPSHEGYRNTIELPEGNNVVPLRSDTIQLVQNGCSFHRLRFEDVNQHLKDFLKLVDSLDLDRERTRLCLFQFSLRDQASNWLERLLAGSISTWDDLTTRFLAQFFPPGRTAKLRNDILMFQQHHGESLSEAWTHFKDLLQKVPHHGIDLKTKSFMTMLIPSKDEPLTNRPVVRKLNSMLESLRLVPRSSNTKFVCYKKGDGEVMFNEIIRDDDSNPYEDDLEEIDLKWQLALLSMRAKRYYQKTGKKITINESDTAGYDKSKMRKSLPTWLLWLSQIQRYSMTKLVLTLVLNLLKLLKLTTYKRGLAYVEEQLVFYKKNEVMFTDQIAVLKRDASFTDSEINAFNIQIEKLKKEKESNLIKINNFENASKSLDKLIGSQITDKSRKVVGFESYNAIAPPPTGLFAPLTIDLSNSGLKEFQQPDFEGYGVKVNKSVCESSSNGIKKTPDAPITKEWVSDSDEDESEVMVSDNVQHKPEQAKQPRKISQNPRNNRTNWNEKKTQKLGVGFQFTKKACFVCGSFNHLIKDCDFHNKRMVQKPVMKNVQKGTGQREVRPVWNNAIRTNHQNFSNSRRNFAPTVVLTKSGIVPISTARQNSSRAATPVSAARPINTAAPKPFVNVAKPKPNAFQKSHFLFRRPFNQQTALKNRILNNKVNTTKVNSVNTAKGKRVTSDVGKQGINIVKSSACWVWRPKRNVVDHVSKNSGSYICKQFDYVDQQADSRKNNVLFSETDLSNFYPDFNLPDESQVMLKIPKKDNMYSFDLKNIVPSKVILWNAEERDVVPPGYSYECSCLVFGLRPLVKWISLQVLEEKLACHVRKTCKKVLRMDLSDHRHAHILTHISEEIKKVYIQSFRTISENQCLLQMLNVMEIRRRYIIKAFQIPTDMSM